MIPGIAAQDLEDGDNDGSSSKKQVYYRPSHDRIITHLRAKVDHVAHPERFEQFDHMVRSLNRDGLYDAAASAEMTHGTPHLGLLLRGSETGDGIHMCRSEQQADLTSCADKKCHRPYLSVPTHTYHICPSGIIRLCLSRRVPLESRRSRASGPAADRQPRERGQGDQTESATRVERGGVAEKGQHEQDEQVDELFQAKGGKKVESPDSKNRRL